MGTGSNLAPRLDGWRSYHGSKLLPLTPQMIPEIQRLWRGGILYFLFHLGNYFATYKKSLQLWFSGSVVPGIGSVGDNMKCPRNWFASGNQLRGWKTSPLPRQWEPKSWNESKWSRDTLPCAGWVRSGVTFFGDMNHPKNEAFYLEDPILDHGFLQIPHWKWLMRVPGSWFPHFGGIWMSPNGGDRPNPKKGFENIGSPTHQQRPLRKVGNDSITNNMSMGSSFKVRPTHSVTDELVGGFYTQSSVRSGWLVIGGRGTARHQLGPWNYSSRKKMQKTFYWHVLVPTISLLPSIATAATTCFSSGGTAKTATGLTLRVAHLPRVSKSESVCPDEGNSQWWMGVVCPPAQLLYLESAGCSPGCGFFSGLQTEWTENQAFIATDHFPKKMSFVWISHVENPSFIWHI